MEHNTYEGLLLILLLRFFSGFTAVQSKTAFLHNIPRYAGPGERESSPSVPVDKASRLLAPILNLPSIAYLRRCPESSLVHVPEHRPCIISVCRFNGAFILGTRA